MIEITKENLQRAIAKAIISNLFVQPTGLFRQYRVTNRENGAQYMVDFFVRNRRRFGHCNCKGGQKNLACKHLAGAAAVNVAIARAKQQTAYR